MSNNKMLQALNEQIKHELYSSYLYLGMAAYFEQNNLRGFAAWMRAQSKDEVVHAMKFYDFILQRRWQVQLLPIDVPDFSTKSPLAVVEQVLQHEKRVTTLINNLVEIAVETKDYPSSSFLQWFIDEQVEEEASADAIVQQLKMVGTSTSGLLVVDHHLGKKSTEK